MKLRIAFLSLFFLFLTGAVMATPTTGEAPDSGDITLVAAWDLGPVAAHDGYALRPEAPIRTAVYYPWPCDGFPFPPSPRPFPVPWPFPSPWPGPDKCLPPILF
ncbi:MAG: hypothetical protein OXH32_11875 [Acidobacteria bacterium]|nr:hypothetical protein [Acidobacteriota bacterium]MXZ39200.1 hypothetical protein [Holophagales bacterium]MYF05046.1 hypothetical protein [Holophagales bacterium]